MFPLPQRLRRISFSFIWHRSCKRIAIKIYKPPTRPLELGHACLPAPPARPLARSSAAGSSRKWRRHAMRSGSRRPCEVDKVDCTWISRGGFRTTTNQGRSFPRKIRIKKPVGRKFLPFLSLPPRAYAAVRGSTTAVFLPRARGRGREIPRAACCCGAREPIGSADAQSERAGAPGGRRLNVSLLVYTYRANIRNQPRFLTSLIRSSAFLWSPSCVHVGASPPRHSHSPHSSHP